MPDPLEQVKRIGEEASRPASGLSIRWASEVRPEQVDWLWRDRIAYKMLTVIAGPPGVGKSTINYDVAARLTRQGRIVVVVTAEDHLAAVARPRLEAAEADLTRVAFVTAPLTLPDDAERLRALVEEHDAAMVVLDPLVAFIGDGVNTHRDHHVRRILAPLAATAEATGAAVVVVIHTNKGTGNDPLLRVSGSVGFTGAARAVLLAAEDPENDDRCILAVVKSNLGPYPPPWAYRTVPATVTFEGEEIHTSKIEWLEEVPEVDPRELLAARDPEDRGAREEAVDMLRRMRLDKQARLAAEIKEEADQMGISESTLKRARRALGIPVWREGFQAPFYWGPRPDSNGDDRRTPQPGHHHPDRVDQVGADLHKQPRQDPNLVTPGGVGEGHSGDRPLEPEQVIDRLGTLLEDDAREDPAAYVRRRRIQGAGDYEISQELDAAGVSPRVAGFTIWTSVGVERLAGEREEE